ncbi:MAPEG family protein [Gammaproteobacteria bacterium]|mgnify:CR=1 FL=1|nr:MAPEG family protein [Gammaproteobacteria bacterium]
MSSMEVLVGLVLWSVALTFVLVGVRMSAGKELNSYKPDGNDLSNFGLRVTRAHANCLENLALPAAIILIAMVQGQTVIITDGLALVFLVSRIGQSLVHMLFIQSVPMVIVRATLFTVQHVIIIIWGLKLLGIT